jgi:serine/threonine protein phosphatase 1
MPFTYVIADLHGRHDLLVLALNEIMKRDPGTIITLGDYIDRGPHSRQIIQLLIQGPPKPWKLVSLAGNHELMMLETIRKQLQPGWWIGNGGGFTLVSYGHPKKGPVDFSVVSDKHLDWIKALPLMHVDKHRIYVHAGVDPTKKLGKQNPEVLTWKLYNPNTDVGHGDYHVVHGHHQHENGPKLHKHRTNLDTFAWATGRLVVGVFDDDMPGGPVDLIEIKGKPHPEAE